MMVGNWKVEWLHSFTSLSASNATWLLLFPFVSICYIFVIIFIQNKFICLENEFDGLILISDYAEGDYMISSCFLQKQNKNIKFFFSELRDLQAC